VTATQATEAVGALSAAMAKAREQCDRVIAMAQKELAPHWTPRCEICGAVLAGSDLLWLSASGRGTCGRCFDEAMSAPR